MVESVESVEKWLKLRLKMFGAIQKDSKKI